MLHRSTKDHVKINMQGSVESNVLVPSAKVECNARNFKVLRHEKSGG